MTEFNKRNHVNDFLNLCLQGDIERAERQIKEHLVVTPDDKPVQLLLSLIASAAPHREAVLPALPEELSKAQTFAEALEKLGDRLALQDSLSSAAATSYQLAASIDSFDPKNREPWGGSFNGQQSRRRLFDAIVKNLNVHAIVETGTFRGSTTEYMSSTTDLPVFSCEINPRYFYFSQERLRHFPNVMLRLEDSRCFLRSVVSQEGIRGYRVFFYLDAHWAADLCLREEIDIVLGSELDPIIMVDDFAVPGDPGYQFDDYGPGKILRFEYLTFLAERDLCFFYPRISADKETGAKRGCIVICRSPTSDVLADAVGGLFRLTWDQAMLADLFNATSKDRQIASLMEERREQAALTAKLANQHSLELMKAEMMSGEKDRQITLLMEEREKQAVLMAKLANHYSEENEVLTSQLRKLVKSRWYKLGRRLGLVKETSFKR